jgi:CRP-like cAMP-binding protein
MRGTTKKIVEYEKFLGKIPILSTLLRSERSQLCEALEERTFQRDHKIVTQGEKGDTFYIVKSGKSCIRSK